MNPRFGDFDIKFFTELRPGLIGWVVIDLCFAAKQYVDLGRLTNSMILVVLSHGFYVVDSLWNEEAVLTTMDITTGRTGWGKFGLCSNARGHIRWVRVHARIRLVFLATDDVFATSSVSR